MFAKNLLNSAKSWPFEEARKILDRISKHPHIASKNTVILETGYGPSGLPHIGTFGEVLRTTMVMHAFRKISDIPAKIFVFSDDMDGLRKVPSNVPNQNLLHENLERPLTKVPDPFEKYESFAHHNNAMLMRFLDSFGFEYEFKSSTEVYKSGVFNESLFKILEHYQEIMNIMLPSLREERQKTYSPFLPVCKRTGRVLQVPVEDIDLQTKSIIYRDPETSELVTTSILDGNCKLQWKADWGMRWHALGVDYEMSGKDLIDSVKLSSKICKAIGGLPPESLSYELFLDEEGKKISKSKGNGISMEEWLKYAPSESLSYYMYQSPKRAKRLYFDVIPSAMDDYIEALEKFQTEPDEKKIDSPVFHIHNGTPPIYPGCIKFSMLLNLVQSCNTKDPEILMEFIKKYMNSSENSEKTLAFLKKMADFAIEYYTDFVASSRVIKHPLEDERRALLDLVVALSLENRDSSPDSLQNVVFEVGKRHYDGNLKEWFKIVYGVLFGSENGPKLGSFFHLYGLENSINLIKERIKE